MSRIHDNVKELSMQINQLKGELNSIKEQSIQINQLDSELCSIKVQLDEYFKYVNPEMLLLNNGNNGKKKVLIVGYYGAPNFGDEMMLESVLQQIHPNKNIDVTVMLADNLKYDVTKYGRISVIHFPKTFSDYNVLATHFDCVILGGGAHLDDSYFCQTTPYRISYARSILEVAIAFAAQGKTYVCLGLSSNKNLCNQEYIQKLDFLIRNSTFFSLRDELSFETLRALNIEILKIKIMTDIACANSVFTWTGWNDILPDPNILGIVWFCDEKTYDTLVELIHQLDKRLKEIGVHEYKIKLIPFLEQGNIDSNFYRAMHVSLPDKIKSHINIEPFFNTSEQMCIAFKSVKVMINMRYHGAIINGMLGNRGINISYDLHPHYYTKMKAAALMFPNSYNINYSEMDIDDIAEKAIGILNMNQKSQLCIERAITAQQELKNALSLI